MVLLVLCAFAAGFVDSIAGGGGLIQLPALFVFLPPALAAQVAPIMGINKFSSICGTAVATGQYIRKIRVAWSTVLPAALAASFFSFLGARAVTLWNPAVLKPVILILLIGVAAYTFSRKKSAVPQQAKVAPRFRLAAALAVGSCIGFYDGFFGPGTGTFLMISFVALFGCDFLVATASAKVVNLSTNIAAVSWFAASGNIRYDYAIPMAAANIAGAVIGSRLAILKGSEFVRKFLILAVFALILRFGYEIVITGGWF